VKMSVRDATQLYAGLRSLAPSGVKDRSGATVGQEGPIAESFRLIAMNLEVMLPANGARGIAVVSANPGDGRSFVALHLAIAIGERRRALLVDSAAPREPVAPAYLRSNGNGNGKGHTLMSAARDVLEPTAYPGVWRAPSATSPLGARDALAPLVEEAVRKAMFVVIDTPAAATSALAFEAAREIGHVLYVVPRKSRDMETHGRIRDQLTRLGAEVVGLVVNEV